MDDRITAPARQMYGGADRTRRIMELCRSQQSRCDFPKCNCEDIPRIVDREAAVDRAKIKTRPFVPTQHQEEFINLCITNLPNICDTVEDAVALLIAMLSDYLIKISKPEQRQEAFLTVIECLRINSDAG